MDAEIDRSRGHQGGDGQGWRARGVVHAQRDADAALPRGKQAHVDARGLRVGVDVVETRDGGRRDFELRARDVGSPISEAAACRLTSGPWCSAVNLNKRLASSLSVR